MSQKNTKLFPIRILLAFMLVFVGCLQSQSQNFSGNYSGNFSYGDFSTQLALSINDTVEPIQVLFSSPEQNAYNIPAQNILIQNDSIHFVLQSDYYTYQFIGNVNIRNGLSLVLEVDTKSFPFVLHSDLNSPAVAFNFRDVRFRSKNLLLYGTVYNPIQANGKAIYIVNSSGNQDRSASRSEVIKLVNQGFIVFHTDKRGTGLSDGNWQTASIPELCEDDMHAITYLAETTGLDYNNIGIKGSSQGASKVPYILDKLPELGFGIVVSCPGSTLLESDLNYWINRHSNELASDDLQDASQMQKFVFQHIAGSLSRNELDKLLAENQDKTWFSAVWVPDLDSVDIDRKLEYNPLPYFEKIKQPLLVIQGDKDEIIPEDSLDIIKKASTKANVLNTYKVLEGADHSMMNKGQSDFPYWSSLHPEYLDTLINWINLVDEAAN